MRLVRKMLWPANWRLGQETRGAAFSVIDALLLDALWSSLRWLMGIGIGTIAAVSLYLLGVSFCAVRRPISLSADFFRAIPVIALVQAFFAFFGPAEVGKFLMIAWATAFPIYVHILHAAVIGPEERLIFLAGRATSRERLIWLQLPLLSAAVLGGLRIAVGIGWISVVAAEMLGVFDSGPWSGGLGYGVTRLSEISDYPAMTVYLAVFGILGLGSAAVFEWLARAISRATRLDLR